jgi:steroid 5-alpha reductase family enzyme
LNTGELSNTKHKNNRFKAFSLCLLAYLEAIAAGFLVGWLLQSYLHSILVVFIADVVSTIVIYINSCIFDNASFYDPYWSVQPIIIAIYWFWLAPLSQPNIFFLRKILVFIMVCYWGIRLTLNWARQWEGICHEDWRYVKFREDNPRLFWIVNFTGIQLMPTVVVFLGCLALYPALVDATNSFSVLDGFGLAIMFLATSIEFLADEQMKKFLNQENKKKEVMDEGLWGVSRHPNYFGEISFWWGLYFVGLAANYQYWWTIVGPVIITLLFLFISIPLMEKKQTKKRPEYEEYKERVSRLIPWFPGKESKTEQEQIS